MKLTKHKRQDLFLHAIQATKEPRDGNLYPEPMSDREFREIMISYFLGDDWYVVDPLTQDQANTEAAYEIVERYLGD